MKDDQMERVSVIKPIVSEEVISTDVVKTFHNKSCKYLVALGVLLLIGVVGYILFLNGELGTLLSALNKDHHLFYWMVFVGFLPEIVAGSIGMGYGVICTTLLVILN